MDTDAVLLRLVRLGRAEPDRRALVPAVASPVALMFAAAAAEIGRPIPPDTRLSDLSVLLRPPHLPMPGFYTPRGRLAELADSVGGRVRGLTVRQLVDPDPKRARMACQILGVPWKQAPALTPDAAALSADAADRAWERAAAERIREAACAMACVAAVRGAAGGEAPSPAVPPPDGAVPPPSGGADEAPVPWLAEATLVDEQDLTSAVVPLLDSAPASPGALKELLGAAVDALGAHYSRLVWSFRREQCERRARAARATAEAVQLQADALRRLPEWVAESTVALQAAMAVSAQQNPARLADLQAERLERAAGAELPERPANCVIRLFAARYAGLRWLAQNNAAVGRDASHERVTKMALAHVRAVIHNLQGMTRAVHAANSDAFVAEQTAYEDATQEAATATRRLAELLRNFGTSARALDMVGYRPPDRYEGALSDGQLAAFTDLGGSPEERRSLVCLTGPPAHAELAKLAAERLARRLVGNSQRNAAEP